MANERRLTSIKALLEGLTLTLGSVQLDQPIQITAKIDGQPIAIDANVDGSLSITSMPNLNAAITSMPSITIADIVNLNIDSMPALSAVITSLPALTAAITSMPSLSAAITSIPALSAAITSIPGLTITSMPTNLTVSEATVTSTPTQTQVNVSNASVTILAANANRKQILLRNQHMSGDIYVYFGTPATTTNGMLLLNGETYQFPRKFVYTGIITAIGATAVNKPLLAMEWV